MSIGFQYDLPRIYEMVAENAPEKLAMNESWREKVRQTLNSNPNLFVNKERGVWSIA